MDDTLQPKQPILSKEQKIGFVLLLAFALLTVGLGVLQIRNTMYYKFALNSKVSSAVQDQVNTVDALRFRDTDRDGLSDYDELYVYGTSPYLPDTDGDGIPDGVEVKNGTNPLCAEGTDCSFSPEAAALANSTSTMSSTPADLQAPASQPIVDLQSAITDPVQIRRLLVESGGLKKEIVDKYTDDQLLQMVQEMMGASSTVSNTQTLNNISVSSSKK